MTNESAKIKNEECNNNASTMNRHGNHEMGEDFFFVYLFTKQQLRKFLLNEPETLLSMNGCNIGMTLCDSVLFDA